MRALLPLPCLLLPLLPAGALDAPRWTELPPLPDRLGVAGPYAGVSGDTLLVAGGANFPDGPPWAGGKKVWHDTVHALPASGGAWRPAGTLPGPRGYGVSLPTPTGPLCIGGSDAQRHYAEVFRLVWDGTALRTEFLPPLPLPLADAAGAVVGGQVMVACGASEPGEKAASARAFQLNLSSPETGWKELPPLPGKPRIQPLAAALGEAFYLAGGAALEPDATGKVSRVYLRDAWRYTGADGWRRLADLPYPVAAAPTPAPSPKPNRFLVLGANDGSRAGTPPTQHPGFNPTVLAYDAAADTWQRAGEIPGARVTVPVVPWRGGWVLPSGEVRPAVRSPQVRELRFSTPP